MVNPRDTAGERTKKRKKKFCDFNNNRIPTAAEAEAEAAAAAAAAATTTTTTVSTDSTNTSTITASGAGHRLLLLQHFLIR